MRDTSLTEAVTRWYDQHARDLPWRAQGVSAWGVLVSEIMLQQTQVNRVEPAWHQWMARWPTPAALAAEPVAEAIRAWGRLGYPRRAQRLHACAVAIMDRHDGAVPASVDELLALPGIGTYTARAVAAFAYRQRHPVVDTNVRRVVARVVEGVADRGSTTTADLAMVEQLLPEDPERAARASVAFMELGALLCTARSPVCANCPLWATCAWRRAGAPMPPGPSRRTQRYAGTDRQVRGLLLAVLREATTPVPRSKLDAVWADEVQRARALASILEDGLACEIDGHYALGATPSRRDA
jgi:A/G-specific adenine glycosylase